jgi:hypothetical protein
MAVLKQDDLMVTTDDLIDFLAGQLADVEAGWSFGTFGAIAEFTRDATSRRRSIARTRRFPW